MKNVAIGCAWLVSILIAAAVGWPESSAKQDRARMIFFGGRPRPLESMKEYEEFIPCIIAANKLSPTVTTALLESNFGSVDPDEWKTLHRREKGAKTETPSEWSFIGPNGEVQGPAPAPHFDWTAKRPSKTEQALPVPRRKVNE
jgi:hypothetical protein